MASYTSRRVGGTVQLWRSPGNGGNNTLELAIPLGELDAAVVAMISSRHEKTVGGESQRDSGVLAQESL